MFGRLVDNKHFDSINWPFVHFQAQIEIREHDVFSCLRRKRCRRPFRILKHLSSFSRVNIGARFFALAPRFAPADKSMQTVATQVRSSVIGGLRNRDVCRIVRN